MRVHLDWGTPGPFRRGPDTRVPKAFVTVFDRHILKFNTRGWRATSSYGKEVI